MNAIGNIYLSWRKGVGASRIPIGLFWRNSNNEIRFKYDLEEVKRAQKDGFNYFPDFPDFNKKEYKDNVLEIIGKRLINSERSDIQKFYDFWEIKSEYKNEKYYLLAHTQGMLPTDNFEFLAEYNPTQDLSFISEICGLSHINIVSNFISVGEELQWKFNKENKFDKNAVEIYKGETYLGNVKLIHCNVFHKKGGENLKIRVKSFEQNGHISRVFIKISF